MVLASRRISRKRDSPPCADNDKLPNFRKAAAVWPSRARRLLQQDRVERFAASSVQPRFAMRIMTTGHAWFRVPAALHKRGIPRLCPSERGRMMRRCSHLQTNNLRCVVLPLTNRKTRPPLRSVITFALRKKHRMNWCREGYAYLAQDRQSRCHCAGISFV